MLVKSKSLHGKSRKVIRTQFYKIMIVPTMLYDSENWVPTQKLQIQLNGLKCLTHVKGCKRQDRIWNEVVRQKFPRLRDQ